MTSLLTGAAIIGTAVVLATRAGHTEVDAIPPYEPPAAAQFPEFSAPPTEDAATNATPTGTATANPKKGTEPPAPKKASPSVSTPLPTTAKQVTETQTADYSCSVEFSVETSWPNGFTESVYITNRGTRAFTPWTLSWSFTTGQRVTDGWNGTWTQAGSRVTVTAPSWATSLQPGTTFKTGYNGSFGDSNPTPRAIQINGTPCRVV
ncbi:cellulose binding domain-containing protein [Amycolatopsis sp. NPDC004378]